MALDYTSFAVRWVPGLERISANRLCIWITVLIPLDDGLTQSCELKWTYAPRCFWSEHFISAGGKKWEKCGGIALELSGKVLKTLKAGVCFINSELVFLLWLKVLGLGWSLEASMSEYSVQVLWLNIFWDKEGDRFHQTKHCLENNTLKWSFHNFALSSTTR